MAGGRGMFNKMSADETAGTGDDYAHDFFFEQTFALGESSKSSRCWLTVSNERQLECAISPFGTLGSDFPGRGDRILPAPACTARFLCDTAVASR